MATTNPAPKQREITTEPRRSDKIFRNIVSTVALSAFVILALIGAFLAIRGFQTFRTQGFHFLTGYEWEVQQDDAGNITAKFGIGAMLVGTVLIAMVALAVGVPLSILTALFLTFYAPDRIKKLLVAVVDLMAAFPSILYGLWGYFVLMPMAIYWAKLLNKYLGWIPVFKVQEAFFERSPFIAGLVLAIMIIPIILFMIMLTTGLGLLFAIAYLEFDDARHLIQVFLMLLTYMTPVFYSLSALGPHTQEVIRKNPLTSFLNVFRESWGNTFNGTIHDWLYLASFSTITFALGFYLFAKWWPKGVTKL